MSIEEKYDEVKELILMGKERGYLLYDEVNDLLPEGICSSDELDSIFSLFGSAGIEVIDTEQKFQDDGNIDQLQLDHDYYLKNRLNGTAVQLSGKTGGAARVAV